VLVDAAPVEIAVPVVTDRIHGAVLKADDRMDRDLKVATQAIEVVEKEVRKAEAQSGRVDRMDRQPHEEIQIVEDRKVEVPRDNADQTVRRLGVRVRKVHLATTMDAAIEALADRRRWIAIDEARHKAVRAKVTVLIAVHRVAAHKATTNEAASRHGVKARVNRSKVVRAKVEARQLVVDEAAMIADQAAEAEEARRSHIVDPAQADLRGCNEDRSVVHNPVADLHSVADHHSDAVDLVVRRWAHRG
jgi:hypothetical protein